jgi:phospholipid/cholesterol/gamma-HCH transport system substrate-binding protein
MSMTDPAAERPLALRLYGVAFLVIVALLLGLSVAIYRHTFTSVVHVQLRADSVGDQLQPAADVKLRGLIVGEVRSISSDGRVATVDLALDPADVSLIPANVNARLLPKTLFGNTYVDLEVPPGPSARPIRAGDVIPQDRTQAGIEVQRVLGDLLPLLRTVQPGKLNATLAAFADALEGRGDQLGANLVLVDRYVSQLNPHLPALQADLRDLAKVTDVFNTAAPDLLAVLKNLTVTGQTVVDKKAQLASFLTGTQSFASTAQSVLDQDGQRIITLAHVTAPTVALLDRYSPEYPCLLQGLSELEPRLQRAFRGGELHITLEVVVPRAPYKPGEEPRYQDRSGPNCRGLPDPAVPAPPVKLADGTSGSAPAGSSAASNSLVSGLAGTLAEQHVVDSILAPVMGVQADEVPAVATLLFGPLARGTAVSVS